LLRHCRHFCPQAGSGAMIDREELWDFSRYKQDASIFKWVILAIWAPFGMWVCVCRLLAFVPIIIMYSLAHRIGVGRLYMRWALPLMGLYVKTEGLHHLDQSSSKIVVSNHVSDFDPIAIWAACPIGELVMVANDVWKTAVQWTAKIGFPVTCVWTKAGGAKQSIKEHLSSQSIQGKRLLMFPEGATTNGAGMLKFHDFIFSLGEPIVPLTIEYDHPWPLNVDYAGSNLVMNILVAWFLPYVVFTYTFLPEVVPSEGATAERTSTIVRDLLCKSLGVPGTIYSAQDKTELKKLHRK